MLVDFTHDFVSYRNAISTDPVVGTIPISYSFLRTAHHPSRLSSSHTGPSQRANMTIESQMIEATESC